MFVAIATLVGVITVAVCVGIVQTGPRDGSRYRARDGSRDRARDGIEANDLPIHRVQWAAERQAERQLKAAIDRGDYLAAERLLAKRVRTHPADGDARFQWAMVQSELGKADEALYQMQHLVKTVKHEGAARWIIRSRYDKRKWIELTAAEQDEFGSLTTLLYEIKPSDLSIRNLYVDYLIASGDLEPALTILRELSVHNPLRGLQAAAVAKQLEQFEFADILAEQSLSKLTSLHQRDPKNSSFALALAQNHILLEQYADAIKTLDAAVKRAESDQQKALTSMAYGDAVVAFLKDFESKSNGSIADHVRILKITEHALGISMKNPRLLTVVSNQLHAVVALDDLQLKAIRAALSEGVATGLCHFYRGIAASLEDDQGAAAVELQRAKEELPMSAAIAHNVAVVLLGSEKPDHEQILQIINNAFKLADKPPPHFFETRAQVLMRLERYQAAIADWMEATVADELAARAHHHLGICYQRAGETALANRHAEIAKKMGWDLVAQSAESDRRSDPGPPLPRFRSSYRP